MVMHLQCKLWMCQQRSNWLRVCQNLGWAKTTSWAFLIAFKNGFSKSKQYKDPKEGTAYFPYEWPDGTVGKDLLSKLNLDPHLLTRSVVVPAEWGLDKDKVDAVHNMFKQAAEASLYAQRAPTEKFPPHVFDGLDVAQLGNVKWQLDGSCHIAISHYSSVA